MKRIAVAGFQHETNTFSPVQTTLEDFESVPLQQLGLARYNSPVSGFYQKAKEYPFQILPLVNYSAEPSNVVPRVVFDELMKELISQVRSVALDGLFLDLHGAMVIEGYLDGETEILQRLRQEVGGIPIVASLDLHGNISQQSMELCSAFISCRAYPHVDMYETGERCAVMMDHLLRGKPACHAFRMAPYLMTSSKETTFRDPSQALYAKIDEVESWSEVLSASIMQGFAGADVEHMGPSVFAYADSQPAADGAVDFLFEALMALESEFTSDLPGVQQGVAEAVALSRTAQKPVVIADVQDNAGGGSSSDTMFILRELQRQGASDTVIGMIFDPAAADAAHAAGEGARIDIALGGKYMQGDSPLAAVYQVERIHDGLITGTGPMAKGMQFAVGKMALLRLDGILIVVGSTRLQAADQSLFTVLGVDPAKMKIVVVKSANHFRADFEPIASRVISIIAPGSDVEDPATFTYRNLRSGVRLHGNGPVHIR